MDGAGVIIAFWLLAVITIGSALGIAGARNLIHAVVFLITTMMGLAGLYITLSADFIAIVQILVYVGAISVLFLFAIVLTPRADRTNQDGFLALPALALCTLVGALLIYVALDTDWNISDRPGFAETASGIGTLLLDKFVLPFEIGRCCCWWRWSARSCWCGRTTRKKRRRSSGDPPGALPGGGAILFTIGLYLALGKRNFVGVLMGIELMFNAVNLTFVSFSRFVESDSPLSGHVFVVFVITVAAAEAATALALAVMLYRVRDTIDVEKSTC